MLNKLKKTNKEGFTIIEVMIVLAIAGLILVIVLLAVPALQRNSRNTTLKSDASQTLGYINDNISNNNGTVITSVSGSGGTVSVVGATTTQGKISGGTTVTSSAFSASAAHTITTANVYVYVGETCGNTTTADKYTEPATGSSRAVAVVYEVETQSGNQPTCIGG